MNSITAGPATHGNQKVACLWSLVAAIGRDSANGAAKDQWIGQIPVIENDGAVDRRNADPVAIVANAAYDAANDLGWLQNPWRHRFRGCVRRRETKHIGVADGLRAEARS